MKPCSSSELLFQKSFVKGTAHFTEWIFYAMNLIQFRCRFLTILFYAQELFVAFVIKYILICTECVKRLIDHELDS